jgi:hypothetical protein
MRIDSLDNWHLSRELHWPFEKCKKASERVISKQIDYVPIIKRRTNNDLCLYFYSRIKFHIKLYQL